MSNQYDEQLKLNRLQVKISKVLKTNLSMNQSVTQKKGKTSVNSLLLTIWVLCTHMMNSGATFAISSFWSRLLSSLIGIFSLAGFADFVRCFDFHPSMTTSILRISQHKPNNSLHYNITLHANLGQNNHHFQ